MTRHNHHELGKKIQELCVRISELEYNFKIVRALTQDWMWEFYEKCVKDIMRQEKRAEREKRKLKKLKDNYSYLGGMGK